MIVIIVIKKNASFCFPVEKRQVKRSNHQLKRECPHPDSNFSHDANEFYLNRCNSFMAFFIILQQMAIILTRSQSSQETLELNLRLERLCSAQLTIQLGFGDTKKMGPRVAIVFRGGEKDLPLEPQQFLMAIGSMQLWA